MKHAWKRNKKRPFRWKETAWRVCGSDGHALKTIKVNCNKIDVTIQRAQAVGVQFRTGQLTALAATAKLQSLIDAMEGKQ